MAKNVKEWYEELRKVATGEAQKYHTMSNLYLFLRDLYFPGMHVLDVGGGPGHFFRELSRFDDIKYTVLDVDPEKIKIGKEVWKNDARIDLHVHDINSPFGVEKYDVVICFTVLVHLIDFKEAVKNLFLSTKKHLLIRNLFSKQGIERFQKAIDGYDSIYPFDGKIPYNSVPAGEVIDIMSSLGKYEFVFASDADGFRDAIIKNNIINNLLDHSKFSLGSFSDGWRVLYVRKY